MERSPTMNLQHSKTELGRADPLKHIFRAIFEVMPDGARSHVVATIGEFLGTMLFFILAFGGVEVGGASSNSDQKEGVSTKPPTHTPGQLLYVALSAGFSLVVCVWTFFRISGGLFNPAVSKLLTYNEWPCIFIGRKLSSCCTRSLSAWH
jgi:aquaporin related protein